MINPNVLKQGLEYLKGYDRELSYEQFREYVRGFVSKFPRQFTPLLKRTEFAKITDRILTETDFLHGVKLSTRIFYLRNGFKQQLKCTKCGIPIDREFKATVDRNMG